jgi:hypothetical protein
MSRATSRFPSVAGAAVRRRPLGDSVRQGGETVRAGHVLHDQGFESLLAGVGGHRVMLLPIKYTSSSRRCSK